MTTEQVRRRTLFSGTIGAVVEWYEYTVYATAAALVFGTLFFPAMDPSIAQIAALATFGVGFIARPVGAFVAGHLGDRIGRKSTLILTFAIMTAATAMIGLLPTYEAVGALAPILLCVLRLAQGFAVGGEWGGAAIIAVENAPKGKRGFYGSWPQIGVSCGLLLGTAAVALAGALTGDAFTTWGWRIPFLLSIVLAAVGLYIRLNASESPEFLAEKEKMAKEVQHRKAPITELLAHHRKPLLIAIFARFAEAGNYYLFTVFVLSYVTTTLKVPQYYGLTAVMIGSALNIIMIPVFGRLSDRIGRKRTFLLGGTAIVLTAWPIFALIGTGQQLAIILGVALFLALGHALVYAPLPALYCELFPTAVRYSGISIGYQMASILLAGFMPALASALVLWSGGTWSVVLIIIASTIVAMVSVSFANETKDLDLADIGKTQAPTRSKV
ncbi:MFS transporter [Arthrobacter sp. B3I9]|uniref:MFS transporter n=1 Tax=Arthrobacter sp. B3I9 TaxID=3042270 RepID=UPI0027D771CD|nr:MFS transporter [Arthrobacter sp. B3I9]